MAHSPSLPSRFPLLAIAAIVCAVLLGYPLRHGSGYLDDFAFLALGRHLANPFVLLVQDSLGAFFFRPLGMFLWWCTVALFGDSVPAHLALDVAVHTANGLLVYALLRQLRLSFTPAAAAAIFFIVHPAAFSTVAWLSNRFDLFATFFGLLALREIDRALERPTRLRLAGAVLAALAAMLCKETGFAIPAVAVLMCWWIQPRHAASVRQRVILAGALMACALVVLGLRPFVLRTEASLLRDPLLATLWGGVWKWLQGLPGILVVVHGSVAGVAAWLAAFMALMASGLLPGIRRHLRDGDLARATVIGFALMLATALTQAPIVHVNPMFIYELDTFELQSLIACRLYYLPLAGFALFVGALLEALARQARGERSRYALLAAAGLGIVGVVAMIATGRTIGREWTALVAEGSERYVRAAVEVVRPRTDAVPGCKIYFLGTPLKGFGFRLYADVAVKQALPRGHPAVDCFVQSEHTPWFHLVTARAAGHEQPLETLRLDGRPFAPLTVGNIVYEYLNVPDSPQVRSDPLASFHAWDGARFQDVTEEIRSGRRAVRFFDVRPPP